MIKKAMIFSAGYGSRLAPFTDKHPKCLAKVNGITLLERNIKYLKNYGINQIIVNVHHFANQVIDFIDNKDFGIDIHISDESNNLLDTGGGMLFAKDFFISDNDFVMMNVDILTDFDLGKMIIDHNSKLPLVTLAVCERESSRKLLCDNKMRLIGWRNYSTDENIIGWDQKGSKKDKNDISEELAFSGIHIINTKIFNFIKPNGKVSIMKYYMELMPHFTINLYDHTGSKLIDVGTIERLRKAEKLFE